MRRDMGEATDSVPESSVRLMLPPGSYIDASCLDIDRSDGALPPLSISAKEPIRSLILAKRSTKYACLILSYERLGRTLHCKRRRNGYSKSR